MNKAVLIFGLGTQGKKYAQYFARLGYRVEGVIRNSQSKCCKVDDLHYFGDEVLKKEFLSNFHYIIVAITPPGKQGELLLQLCSNSRASIIAEKPVGQSLDAIAQILSYENISVFIDEAGLPPIPLPIAAGDEIHIFARDKDVAEHAVGLLITNKAFKNAVLKIHLSENLTPEENYKILAGKYILINKGGEIYINSKRWRGVVFDHCLDGILSQSLAQRQLTKENFLRYFPERAQD